MTVLKLDRDPDPEFDNEPDTGLGLIDCSRCGFRGRGISLCHCPTCHLTFTSITGFDDHRTGGHADDSRRCRTPEQIKERGYDTNDAGYWRRPMTGQLDHWKK